MNAPKKTGVVVWILKKAVRDMRTLTYGEIAEGIDLTVRDVEQSLACIRDECRNQCRPWLPVIAVGPNKWRPYAGLFAGLPNRPDKSEFEAWWRGMVLHVYQHDWSSFKIDD